MDRTVISAIVSPEFAAKVKEAAAKRNISISRLIAWALVTSLAPQNAPGEFNLPDPRPNTPPKPPVDTPPKPPVDTPAEDERPSEELCIEAGKKADIPEDAVRKWLEYMRKFDWRFHSGGRVTAANFRTSLMKWWDVEQRKQASKRAHNASGDGETCGRNRRRPISISDRERKKPSWMTWEQWQFEEAERMQNHRRNENVERLNEALDAVGREFGI